MRPSPLCLAFLALIHFCPVAGSSPLPPETKTSSTQKGQEGLKKAARQGNAQAQYDLGRSYADFLRRDRHPPRAVQWLTRAAEQGHAGAWLELGHLYAKGDVGVVQDLALARECYKKAEKNADDAIWGDLGRIYVKGWHGLMSWPKAYACYLEAARAGNAYGQLQLGQMYQHGVGTAVNPERAAYWYNRAAESAKERDFVRGIARLRLAWCYEHGFGVPRSRERALAEYRRLETYHLFGSTSPLARQVWEEHRRQHPDSEHVAPITDDLELRLETQRKEYQIDELVKIRVSCNNVGRETFSFTERGSRGPFVCSFDVQDEKGRKLPNPFQSPSDIRFSSFVGMIATRVLGPGQSVVERHTLNQCVHFDRPGTYTISTTWCLPLSGNAGKSKQSRRVIATPLRLTIRPCDPRQRQQTIDRLLEAYRAGKGIPEGIAVPVERFADKDDVLRLLAFYCEPRLIPFFLDVLESKQPSLAEEALWGMPDRAAVIRAYEERLEHPEKYNSPALLPRYFELITPDHMGAWLEEFPNEVRRLKLGEKYRARAMQVLRQDTAYAHPRLVAGLLGGAENLFLVDYLLRCHPGLDDLRACGETLGRVKLGREHIPFLESLLDVEDDTGIREAALLQLVRLDRRRYLPEVTKRREQLAPEVVRVLLDDSDD